MEQVLPLSSLPLAGAAGSALDELCSAVMAIEVLAAPWLWLYFRGQPW